MEPLAIQNQERGKKIKILGIYQIAGGAAGLGITIWLVTQISIFSVLLFLLLFVATSLYSYSIFCGILLIQKKSNGLAHSLINQYLQLANFAILGYGFKYIAGLYFLIGADISTTYHLNFNFGVMSTWEIDIANDPKRIEFNINIVALLLIIFIINLRKGIVDEKNDIEIVEVGQENISDSSG